MMSGNQKLLTKEQSSFTELIEHQEAIILDLETLYYYSLNASATFLWKLLRSGKATTPDALTTELAATFGLDNVTANADTQQFLAELLSQGLLTTTDGVVTSYANFTLPVAVAPAYEAPCLKTSNAVLEMSLAGLSSTATPGTAGS